MTMNQSIPFVFLPGTLCDERLWHHQLSLFPDSIVVNLRSQNSLQEMLDSVSDVKPEKFILVGFSLGGNIAQEFTIKFQERVQHLVLIGSSSLPYPKKEKEAAISAIPFIEKGLFKGITDRRLREFLHPKSYEDKELRDLIRSMSGVDAGVVYLKQINATLDRPDLSEKLKSITCPLTAIAGANDAIVNVEDVLILKGLNKNFKVEVVNECGHFVPLEKPEIVNTVLSKIKSGSL